MILDRTKVFSLFGKIVVILSDKELDCIRINYIDKDNMTVDILAGYSKYRFLRYLNDSMYNSHWPRMAFKVISKLPF